MPPCDPGDPANPANPGAGGTRPGLPPGPGLFLAHATALGPSLAGASGACPEVVQVRGLCEAGPWNARDKR